MHILLLRHYPLLEGPSMRSYADQIVSGLRSRGHTVQQLTAPVLLGSLLPSGHAVAKWLGYVDQFLIFPPWLWLRARMLPRASLCVLSDQALGPWFPWLSAFPHVVHCHDLLALEAAMGQQPFHQLGRSGRLYQRWIRRGFRRARCFLSVSEATKRALERQLDHRPLMSAVLYNPLSPRFTVLPKNQASAIVRRFLPGCDQQRYLFHIGRNWYKNRLGVLAIWEQLHLRGCPHHLVLVGAVDTAMHTWLDRRPQLSSCIHVLETANDELVVALYNLAAALLFPSHAEGFGWPILEALACGCPVITTNRAPMTEVGGQAVTTIPPAPHPPECLDMWARDAAEVIIQSMARSPVEREKIRQLGFAQASCFKLDTWLDQLECYYKEILQLQVGDSCAV